MIFWSMLGSQMEHKLLCLARNLASLWKCHRECGRNPFEVENPNAKEYGDSGWVQIVARYVKFEEDGAGEDSHWIWKKG